MTRPSGGHGVTIDRIEAVRRVRLIVVKTIDMPGRPTAECGIILGRNNKPPRRTYYRPYYTRWYCHPYYRYQYSTQWLYALVS